MVTISPVSYFNSNMVRLKARLLNWLREAILNFNSNMVRLKEENVFAVEICVHYFNSNMVRLKDVAKIRFFSKNKGL